MSMPQAPRWSTPGRRQIVTMADVFGARSWWSRRRVRCPVDESAAGRGRGGQVTPSNDVPTSPTSLWRTRGPSSASTTRSRCDDRNLVRGTARRSSDRGPWTVSCSTCSPHGSASTSSPTRSPRRRAHLLRRHGRNCPRSPRRAVTRAPSPSPAPGVTGAWVASRGLAVRPQHHARTPVPHHDPAVAPGVAPRRCASAARWWAMTSRVDEVEAWSRSVGERIPSEKRVRRVRKTVTAGRVTTTVTESSPS